MKQRPYIVPDNYFENLQDSLGGIPSKETARRGSPYYALAAVAVAALAIMVGLFHFSTRQNLDPVSYEYMVYADLIPHTEEIYADAQDSPDAEDLIQYMIDEGYTLDSIVEP